MKINADQLVAFSLVAELGSVSRAAERLNLSQPTVSSQLRGLQDQVGQPLYRRRAHGVELTPAGEALLPYAHAVARTLRQVSGHISGVRGRPEQVLRLGLSYTLGHYAYALATHAEAGEGIGLSLSAGDSATLAGQVVQGELDGALLLGPLAIPTDRLDTFTLGEDELVMVLPAAHPLPHTGYAPLHVLDGQTLLWAGRTSSVRRQIERLLERAAMLPRSLELGSLHAVRDALLEGHGIAILPREFVRHELRFGLVRVLGIEAPSVTVTKLLVTPPVATQGEVGRELLKLVRGAKPSHAVKTPDSSQAPNV